MRICFIIVFYSSRDFSMYRNMNTFAICYYISKETLEKNIVYRPVFRTLKTISPILRYILN